MIDFLSMKEDQKFEKIMKQSEKEKEISKIQDMTNLKGHYKINFTNSSYIYKEESFKFFGFSEQ